jgi:CRP-like cAMP-binding protein
MKRIPCEQCATYPACIVGDLPADGLDAFRAASVTGLYRRRQVIFHEDTPAEGLYLLCHGAVKLYQSDRAGRDHILAVAGPGDVLSEMPFDAGASYAVSAEALTDAQVCYLPRERLLAFIERHPMAGIRLIAALSRSLAAARRKVRDLALKYAEGRLAELLLQLARAAGAAESTPLPARIVLPYSRREIAEMIGVSTETAIRLLGKLKRQRVIATERRDLIVTDLGRLARIAGG